MNLRSFRKLPLTNISFISLNKNTLFILQFFLLPELRPYFWIIHIFMHIFFFKSAYAVYKISKPDNYE